MIRLSTILKGLGILIAAGVIFLIATTATHTPPFLNADGRPVQDSIAEERMMELGGAAQYVLIRGRDRTAPLLVFLHGGPGTTAMPFNRIYNRSLEDHFVFVNWDQRGTGKSLAAGYDPATLTLAQMIEDLNQLIDRLCAEFEQDQVLLIGHSWGSLLGLEYVLQHPEKIAAYIGVGQVTQSAASEADGYAWAVAEATSRGDNKMLAMLEALGPPPYESLEQIMAERAAINAYGGVLTEPMSNTAYALKSLKAPEYAWPDLRALLSGAKLSIETLLPVLMGFNASETHLQIEAPVFIFEGRFDQVISTRQAELYFNQLIAPHKQLVWFEHSAHSPQWEEPDRYQNEVLKAAQQVGLLP